MREFGLNPRIAWHVDAFGHSMTSAQIFLDMGYEALFFARMDDNEKAYRIKTKQMEFIWHPTYSDEQRQLASTVKGLFTHNMIRHYNPPCGITVQNYFNKGDINSEYAATLYKYKNDPNSLVNCIKDSIDAYRTHNLLWIFGDDFSFYDA